MNTNHTRTTWNWRTDDGRTGSSPTTSFYHGDFIRELLMSIEGPGILPVPKGGAGDRGEYACKRLDGSELYVSMYRA